jgi:hypothetical protein
VKKGHQYPHVWKIGPDPELHRRYEIWLQQRNQAQWRGETWQIPFDTWLALWQHLWHLRGRRRGCVCMSRIDWDGAWEISNVEIVPREVHTRQQREHRAAGWVSPARQKEIDKEQKCK